MTTPLMKRSTELQDTGNFSVEQMIKAIATDLYESMLTAIEAKSPESDLDTTHKLALLNSMSFCHQCIESDKYETEEKMIMAMVGKHLAEIFEHDFKEQDNA
jgi:hypothetical protein